MIKWELRESVTEPPPKAMPKLIWHTLYSRGVRSTEQMEEHFSPKLNSLSDPFSIIDMPLAVDRLVKALDRQEKICIYFFN